MPYAKKASDYLDLGNDRMFSAARAKRLLEEDGVSLPPPKETSKIIHVHPQPPDLVENVRYQQLLGWLVHDATAAFDKIGSPLSKFTTPAMSPAEQVKHESGAVLDRLLVWVTQRRAIVLAVALFGMVLASLAPLVTTRSAPSSVVETFIAGTTREPIGSPLIEPYNRWPKPERLTGWKGNVMTFSQRIGAPLGISEIGEVYLSTGHDLRRLLVLSMQTPAVAQNVFDALRQSRQVTTLSTGQLISVELGLSITRLGSILFLEELEGRFPLIEAQTAESPPAR